MFGTPDLLTVLAAIVAVVVIFKLRGVLGRRTSDDESRIDRKIRAEQAEQRARAAQQDKVVTLPRKEPEQSNRPAAGVATAAEAEARLRNLAGGNAQLEQVLLELGRLEPSFDGQHFIAGARQAYELIVTAFAEGNRKTLKELLSRDVFDGFAAAIAEREGRGELIDQSFVGISKADVVEAELKGSQAQLTVKFVSQLISATRDRSGAVVAGDPQKIKDVTDIWTFARDVGSRDPNWRLIATQAPN
jgi:predicted lipid-binding transport protein (Tim44 family)